MSFGRYMPLVARHFWGEPNEHLSSADELRWGSHGARSVKLPDGVWYDNETGQGGGVLDLIIRDGKVVNGQAVAYLKGLIGPGDDEIAPFRPFARRQPAGAARTIVATYDYRDEAGELVFQVVRYAPKDFRQRRPDPGSPEGWSWSVKGVRQVPYRLPDVLEATASGSPVVIVEGEKDADALWTLGVPATTNAGGAGKWRPETGEALAGCHVVVCGDNDDAGQAHVGKIAQALEGVAASVRVLQLPGLPAKGDVSDWIRAGGTADQLWRLIDNAGQAQDQLPSRFGAVTWAGLDKVVALGEWLVEDLIFRGDFGLAYGESQSGKSFLVVDMGLAIARGAPFLGKKTRRGGVVYQAGEGGRGLIKRLKAYRQHHELAADADIPFVLLTGKADLYGAGGDTEAMIAETKAWAQRMSAPLELVVVDTFAAASPGANENASEHMSIVIGNLQRIQDECQCAVIAVHHKNAAGERPRGHTSLFAAADVAMEVAREHITNDRWVRLSKIKDSEDGEKIGFKLHSVTIGHYADSGKPITSCVVSHEALTENFGARVGLTTAGRFFLKCLSVAISNHGVYEPGEIQGLSPYTKVVDWTDLRDVYRSMCAPDELDNTIVQRMRRSNELLVQSGHIGRSGNLVWLSEKGRRAQPG